MPACPRRSLAVSLTVCSALVTGCGSSSGPKLHHADAAVLSSLAHRIANDAPGAQARDISRLSARTIALINAGKVPSDLQEPLMSAVGALAVPHATAPAAQARNLEAWLRRYSD